MVAVVDLEIDDGIIVGAAAASREFCRLVDRDTPTGVGEFHGRGEAGEPRADDVNGSRHQAIPWRSTATRTRSLFVFTRVRGGAKPRARRSDNIWR